jgi:hypothetical protein
MTTTITTKQICENRLKFGLPYESSVDPPILNVRRLGTHVSSATHCFKEQCEKHIRQFYIRTIKHGNEFNTCGDKIHRGTRSPCYNVCCIPV